MGEHERIVIGAGPAGCAVALRLAAAGQRPLLLERSRAVRPRLCGEFVSAEAAAALAALGVDVAALGGRETRHLRLAFGRQCIEAELPFTAFGLSRAALDAALQARVQAAGVPLWRGARASLREVATARRPHRLCVTMPDGTAAALHTRSLLLACGKTDLAPLQRRPRRAPESLVGLQWHLRLQPEHLHALHGHVEVLLFEHGYGGLQPVEDGRVNLCLLVPPGPPGVHLPALLRALGGECPLLAQRLDGAQGLETAPRTIFRVP